MHVTQVKLSLYELAETATPTLTVQRLESTTVTHLGVDFVAAALHSRQTICCPRLYL
jgi:hypothetical protein